ncbi:nuclear-pore anchor [Quercus suber]|uniref:Nuclear-pore anchor n=1 Tax=Quercus suber TaxID=58331 RepID=A0AAW0KW04_QUESU
MPLFMTEEEFRRCVQANDAGSVAEKADAYIRELFKQVETVRAEADAGSITAEQTCSLLEQKYISLSSEFAKLDSQNAQLQSSLDRHLADLALLQSNKHQQNIHSIGKDGEIETLATEVSELHKSKRQLIELVAQKDLEISEKNATIKSYLDKIVNSSNSASQREVRVSELESELARTQAACTRLKEELCSSKAAAAANEERLSAELSTVNKLVELYKESSEEWSRKAGELEGVIKALETHLSQVENDYKERLEKEVGARNQFEKEAAELKEKLEKCEADIESSRKSNELNLVPLSNFSSETWMTSFETNDMVEDDRMIVPKIPAGVSGTALAASLLRDGWSLAKMYAKYQEAVDALRHEQLGRKQSEAILQRVLYELEEKAEVILEERVEHERMAEAYSMINQRLQNSLSEQANLEKTIQELKADLRRHERDYNLAQKEIFDLQKQVTVLLKECRDIQLRCGSTGLDGLDDGTTAVGGTNLESDTEKVISERLLTFKDINGLVEQNVQLRSLVRSLSDEAQSREMEFKETFEMELKKHTDEAASKVAAVLQRAEEQGRMIESLHTSVAMYKRLYEEEHKLQSSLPHSAELGPDNRRTDLKLLLERSQEASKKAHEQAVERVKCLEEELSKSRSEIISLRSDRDKLALESNFARERLESFMKEFEHQRNESNGILARNVEFSQLVVDYQRKLRESSESLHAAEERSRKLTMEVSVLKQEKEMLSNAEKRACTEVCSLSVRVHRLQVKASLDTIQSAEEVREEARVAERRKQEEYVKHVEREWAEAKRELQEERDNVRNLTVDREQTLKNAMRQVEEMGKELADALRAVVAAESRAAVAEAKLLDLERKSKSSDAMDIQVDGGNEPSSFSSNEVVVELRMAKEEIEKLKVEAQANKDHMQQYKSIAQVNEDALRQMECAHETFKIEADKLKKSLEAELLSLRERVSELEYESGLKSEEVASVAAGNEETLASSLAEITILKEEISVKTSQVLEMEIQISAVKEDLEKEHQRWRAAQANYERQVILQSETIQELTKTSQTLASLQQEASELRKLADAHRSENNELKAKWEVEKAMLEGSKNDAEKKYNEINEQLESALKAAETSQASLQANRANSRALLFTEEEIKSLQLQVREMNLLRESNMQLREENKHNFEECQKLREITQKARTETENLESLLRERQIEVEACKKEIEMQKVERDNLETRFCELLERCKNIDVDDYNRMKDDVQQMQEKLKDKDAQIVEIRKLLSERQDIISKLEQDLSKCKLDLNEREKRINDILLVEANSKQDVERQKKIVIQFKRKYEIALKEKEELSKENQTLSKQLEESKHGKRSVVDTTGEQAMKEEKDTKIQTLEKHLERLREELRKEKDRRSKIEKAIRDSYNNVDQDKTKFVNELEMHKQALKRISDELQKLKHAKDNLPEGTSVVQLLSGTVLDDLAAAYVSAVENFQKTAHLVFSELGARGSLVEPSSIADTALTAAAGPAVSVQAPSIAFSAGPATSGSPAKATEESEKRFTLPKAIVETRKTGRKLNRPRLVRPEEPQGDIEMSEVDGARNVGKAAPSSDIEAQGNLTLISQPLVRKRIASASASDLHDESVIQGETGSDVAAPLLKKSKGLEPPHESSEGQFSVPVENLGTLQAPEETLNVVELAQASNEEAVEADKEEIETTGERTEDGREQLDGVSQDELLSEKNNVLEENLDRPGGSEMVSDEGPKDQAEPDNQQLMTESGSEREEGELEPDVTEPEGGGGDISNIIGSPEPGEGQPEPVASPLASPARADDESLAAVTLEVGEINSPEVLNDEKNDEGDVNEETAEGSDKSNDGNDQIPVETDQVMEALCVPLESASASASSEIDVSKQGIPVSKQGSLTVTTEAEVVRQASPVSSTSTTINLSERARQNAAKRLGVASSPVVRGGRGRAAPRARGSRGRGRLGRGQSSGEQG